VRWNTPPGPWLPRSDCNRRCTRVWPWPTVLVAMLPERLGPGWVTTVSQTPNCQTPEY